MATTAQATDVVSELESGSHVVTRETFMHGPAVKWFWRQVGERRGYGRTPFDVQALARSFPSDGNGPFVREIQAALRYYDCLDCRMYSKNFTRQIEAYQTQENAD